MIAMYKLVRMDCKVPKIKFSHYYYGFKSGKNILHLTIHVIRPNGKIKNHLKYILFRPDSIRIKLNQEEVLGTIEVNVGSEELEWIREIVANMNCWMEGCDSKTYKTALSILEGYGNLS
jgi:hypothetical protein